MDTNRVHRTRRNLIIFTLVVLGLSVIARIIEPMTIPPDAGPDAAGLGQGLWLIAPLFVALILRAFAGDGWSDFGLRPNFRGNAFWWLVNILVYPITISISVVLALLLGGASIDKTMLAPFLAALIPGLSIAFVKNVFEEFAWRGYLAPKLYSLSYNIWLSHTIIGLIWGAWHLPFMFVFWPYLSPEMLPIFIPLLFLGTISSSMVYGEIRLATNSVLPAWIMHTIGNGLGNTLLLSGYIKLTSGTEMLYSPGAEGIANIVFMFIIALWLHRRRAANWKSI